MAVQYDPKILQQFADDLYEQAGRIALATATWFTLVVLVIFSPLLVLSGGGRMDTSGALPLAAVIAAFAFGAGFQWGKHKAFTLKLKAQQILCQREIELNTRRRDQAAGTGS